MTSVFSHTIFSFKFKSFIIKTTFLLTLRVKVLLDLPSDGRCSPGRNISVNKHSFCLNLAGTREWLHCRSTNTSIYSLGRNGNRGWNQSEAKCNMAIPWCTEHQQRIIKYLRCIVTVVTNLWNYNLLITSSLIMF